MGRVDWGQSHLQMPSDKMATISALHCFRGSWASANVCGIVPLSCRHSHRAITSYFQNDLCSSTGSQTWPYQWTQKGAKKASLHFPSLGFTFLICAKSFSFCTNREHLCGYSENKETCVTVSMKRLIPFALNAVCCSGCLYGNGLTLLVYAFCFSQLRQLWRCPSAGCCGSTKAAPENKSQISHQQCDCWIHLHSSPGQALKAFWVESDYTHSRDFSVSGSSMCFPKYPQMS